MIKILKILIIILCLIIFSSFAVNAQLCEGSLGDPVVDITFGSGSNPGPPLVGTTTYTFNDGDCPPDGSYTIESSTNSCYSWYTVPHDHTGDPNGYMMVINASYEPGFFFIRKVSGLCPNTTYQFAAWIMNLNYPSACAANSILPNVTFNIESTSGRVIKTYSTGDIPTQSSPTWTQYGFFFTSDSSSDTVVLRMINNAPGGCGNDLLLDDITFRACGPLVNASVVGNPDSINVCTGDTSTFIFNANVSAGYSNPIYQWEVSTDSGSTWSDIPGANDTFYVRPAVITPGNYLYRLAVSERSNLNISSCSIISNLINISVNKYPVPGATSVGACLEDTLTLKAAGGGTYLWSGPSGFTSNQQNPVISNTSPADDGMYYVQVTSTRACTSFDSTLVQLTVKPTVQAGNDTQICEGKVTQLNATGSNITSYYWSPAYGLSSQIIPDPIAQPDTTTLYILTAYNVKCPVTDSVHVLVNKNPSANAGPDKVIISGQSTFLNGTVGGSDITYTWQPDQYIDSVNTLTPVVNPPANQYYLLRVVSNVGCGTAIDSVLVKVFEKLFIPNAFTPNNDGINDTWYIETLQAYPGAEVKVYNRYGQLVFDNKGKNFAWDGTLNGQLLPSGAYVYTIDLKNNTTLIKGVVYLLY
jgi:gliding motility-associated-like protein